MSDMDELQQPPSDDFLFVTQEVLAYLVGASQRSPKAVAWAAYDWLAINDAGTPMLALIAPNVRDDARFWAETAHPGELECYALAAIDKLSAANAPFASKQIRRLVGALWRRMSPDEKKAFLEWIAKDAGISLS